MNIISELKNVCAKILFKNPPRAEVVIFDVTASEFIVEKVIQGYNYQILHARRERFYFSPQIIYFFVKCLKYIDMNQWHKSFLKKLRELYIVYLLSCLLYMKPKVVLTYMDFSYLFQRISRLYTSADFYAIQQGIRLDFYIRESDFSLTNFICFGQHEIDLYNKYNRQVDNFFPVGSLRGSYYRSVISENTQSKYDICVVSQWREGDMLKDYRPFVKKAITTMDFYVKQYAIETGVKVCIALALNDLRELEYYKNTYGNIVDIIEHNTENMSTFRAMDESDIIVSFCSTAALEAIGWGKKVVFTNFSGMPDYNVPVAKLAFVDVDNYEFFKTTLDRIRGMDTREYAKAVDAKYLMNYNSEKPVNIFLQELISKSIEGMGSER